MTPVPISGAVEGPTDESVLKRIVESLGASVYRVQVQHGKPNLRRALPGYNASAVRQPWVVLVDLNGETSCPAALVASWLPAPNPFMRLRVAVRQVEAWLLADAERFCSFFSVRSSRVPGIPDEVPDAKQALLNAVAHSRKAAIRDDILPRPGSGRRVGPAYTSRLIEFATDSDRGWRPEVAAARSSSLARCIERVSDLIRHPPY